MAKDLNSQAAERLLEERSVFLVAQTHFLNWLDDGHFGAMQLQLDIEFMSRLAEASSCLSEVIRELSPPPPKPDVPSIEDQPWMRSRQAEQRLRAILIGNLQDGQPWRPAEEYGELIDDLEEFLLHLHDAAMVGIERGAVTSPVYVWIRFAADQWFATIRDRKEAEDKSAASDVEHRDAAVEEWVPQIPSASERGRFWLSLLEFQDHSGLRSDRIPEVKSRDTARRALLVWKRKHEIGED